MKFKIVAEDKTKGILEIPLTSSEVDALGDFGFMIEDDMWKLLKLNKIDKKIKSAMIKFQHALFDVKDSGATYCLRDKKFVKNTKPVWVVKKSKWKK